VEKRRKRPFPSDSDGNDGPVAGPN
jgi:hypothetical protein